MNIKNIKKTLQMVFANLLVASISAPAFASGTGIKDISGSYAQTEINTLIANHIITGYEDGTFRPTASMTREEFAALLARTLGLEPNSEASSKFADVSGWARPYVGALVKAGLTSGISDTEFGARTPITREQLAVFWMRALDGEGALRQMQLVSTFTDEKTVSGYALPHVSLAQQIGFIKGTDNGDGTYQFQPAAQAERQAVARLAYEFYMHRDAYQAKIHLAGQVTTIVKQAAEAMEQVDSYRMISRQTFGTSTPSAEDLITEYTKTPFAIHAKGTFTGTGRYGVDISRPIETYISGGKDYLLTADGKWETGPSNISTHPMQKDLEKILYLAPYLTLSENNDSHMLTGMIEPQLYNKVYQEGQVNWTLYKQIKFTYTIDKNTFRLIGSSSDIQLQSSEVTDMRTFQDYNQVPQVQVPLDVLTVN